MVLPYNNQYSLSIHAIFLMVYTEKINVLKIMSDFIFFIFFISIKTPGHGRGLYFL